MMYLLAIVLFVLWISGLVSLYTLTGLAQVFLVSALAVVLIKLMGKVRTS